MLKYHHIKHNKQSTLSSLWITLLHELMPGVRVHEIMNT